MTILITGASGFLGRRTAEYFSSLGYDVLAPSHKQLDITDNAVTENWFRKNHPQAVFHCAAVSDTGKCQNDPEGTAKINVDGAVNLAIACNAVGAKLIFCSSDQVYAGSSLPGPHSEAEPLQPGNEYARQKLLAEQHISVLCPDAVSLRLSWMYSTSELPGQHGHLLTTLKAALRDSSIPLTFPIYDHRGITDTNAVVHNLSHTLTLPGGVYNFGAGNEMNTFQTIQTVLEELELHHMLDRLNPNLQAFVHAPRDIRMDTSLAESYGITFPSTKNGLLYALKQYL